MFTNITKVRVGYSDTDQMTFVHHSNYVKYYENARWEAFRALGISYKDIEASGVLMPVISMKFDFLKPAFYDDLLTIKTTIKKYPRARVVFNYELFNESGELINSSEVVLAFLEKDTLLPCLPPENIMMALKEYFKISPD